MRKISLFLLSIITTLVISCSGSDTYRGNWKATDGKGGKFEMNFDAKSFTVKDSKGKKNKYEYTQNSVNIENSVETYGIQLNDGRKLQINFPNANDESLGLIKDENGMPLFTISRNNYVNYEDVFKL